VALFFFFSAIGLLTPSVEIQTLAGAQPLMATLVAIMTVLQMLVAALVLGAIIRFRSSNAERVWQIVAGLVLVLSFVLPFAGIPGAPLGYSLALEAMHIAAGALAIWMLPALAREG
jgi:heme A synthase